MTKATMHATPCPPCTVLHTAFREDQGIHLLSILAETEWEMRPSYAITVLAFDGDTLLTDARTVCDVTSLRAEADRIFQYIADGLVTPCTLVDILSDML